MKSAPNILHLGLDVHKETIAVAIASGDGSVRRYGQIPGHLQAVDTLITKLQKPGQELRFCYEAVVWLHALSAERAGESQNRMELDHAGLQSQTSAQAAEL